jgi:hypothetical protein
MDNGLIFPYPYGIANAESAMLSSFPNAFGLRGDYGPSG